MAVMRTCGKSTNDEETSFLTYSLYCVILFHFIDTLGAKTPIGELKGDENLCRHPLKSVEAPGPAVEERALRKKHIQEY